MANFPKLAKPENLTIFGAFGQLRQRGIMHCQLRRAISYVRRNPISGN
jgi:hypothetical protein